MDVDVNVVRGSVDDVVVCGSVDAGVTSVVVVVVVDKGGISVVVSGFLGARMTNFNSRDRVTAKSVKTIKEMQMILTRRCCHHLLRPLVLWAYSV
jgi:hypothetical protein